MQQLIFMILALAVNHRAMADLSLPLEKEALQLGQKLTLAKKQKDKDQALSEFEKLLRNQKKIAPEPEALQLSLAASALKEIPRGKKLKLKACDELRTKILFTFEPSVGKWEKPKSSGLNLALDILKKYSGCNP